MTAVRRQEYLRQLDFFDPELMQPKITVIGAGGIGSWTVFELAKLGCRDITVWDHDRVDEHNVSTTPYARADLGKPKVAALAVFLKRYGLRLKTSQKKFGKTSPLNGTEILVSAVDSMDMRRLLFAKAIEHKIPFYVDGRIGGERLRVYSIQPTQGNDRKLYRTTLVPNSRVTPLPCTGQQVIDVGWFTASYITRAIRRWVVHRLYRQEVIVYVDTLQSVMSSEACS